MGWFWADVAPSAQVAPHPTSRSDASPPPGCPMHKSPASSSGTPRSAVLPPSKVTTPSTPAGACPYVPPEKGDSSSPPSKSWSSSATLSKLNPLSYMPSSISNQRADKQSVNLPLEREPSTIPRGDGTGNWEYPSPQQMYNALLKKGYDDTPAEHVESMVAVHNFLNEGAWAEIVEWERRFSGGLMKGWQLSKKGEEAAAAASARDRQTQDPKLVRFMGRPDEMTPKAKMLQVMSWIYPAGFNNEPPFDRHDWFVQRQKPGGEQKEVRYVIDYYSGPPEPTGEPVFYLDVRPAVDGPTAAAERMLRWGGDVWWRAKGGDIREEMQAQRR